MDKTVFYLNLCKLIRVIVMMMINDNNNKQKIIIIIIHRTIIMGLNLIFNSEKYNNEI